MHRPLVRSLLSGIFTACFTLSVLTWGSMATCAVAGLEGTAAGAEHAVHGSPASHGHSHGQHQTPGHRTCVVHLCCAHLALQPSAPAVAGRIAVTSADPGFIAAAAVRAVRPPHSLPFAHAPPAPIA